MPCETPIAKIRKGSRIDSGSRPKPAKAQDPEAPDDGDQGADQGESGVRERAEKQIDHDRGGQEGRSEEGNHAGCAIGDIAHRLGEADDVDVDPIVDEFLGGSTARAAPPRRDSSRLPAGLGVLLEQLRADQSGREVVGHQAPGKIGLENVLPDLLEALAGRLEIRPGSRCRQRSRPPRSRRSRRSA